MPAVMKTQVVKTISEAQFSWSFKRGLIWEREGGLYSSEHEYQWVVPFIDRNGDMAGGYYEVLESKLFYGDLPKRGLLSGLADRIANLVASQQHEP